MKRVPRLQLISSPDAQGFTLVELLITMSVSLFVMGVVYTAYTTYQRQYANQIQIVEMQQNVRSALNFMMDEIRMAGYNPQDTSTAGILSATPTSLNFTKDTTNSSGTANDGDGLLDGPYENVAFGFVAGADILPAAPGDGIADNGAALLGITTGGSTQPIAENIAALEFFYTLENEDGTRTTTTTPSKPKDIRSVTISLLARAANRDPNYTDNFVYTTASGTPWGPFNDNFRRRLLTTTVKCRNMGL